MKNIAEIRALHIPKPGSRDHVYCLTCPQSWPCDAQLLLGLLDLYMKGAVPCQHCGKDAPEFVVPNDAWNTIVRNDGREGPDEYICLACFANIAADRIRNLRKCVVVGFYENEYPEYSNEWTNELQTPVTPAELNALVDKLKRLEARESIYERLRERLILMRERDV